MIDNLGPDAMGMQYPTYEPTSQPITPTVKPPTLSIKKTMLAHMGRDMLGQVVGRAVGLGIFNAAAYVASASVPCKVIAGGLGAVFGGLQAQRLAAAQIGSGNTLQYCGVVACTFLGAAAGAAIASVGTYQPVAALAVGSALAITVSLAKFCTKRPSDDIAIDASKATIFLISTAATVSAITSKDTYLSSSVNLAPKNLGVVLEATIVESFKSSLERWGPSVDRHALNFNGKVYVSIAGLLPYLAASVFLNGWVSGKMQPEHESHQFEELILPLLIGAIANGVRGACNAGAVYVCHQNGWGVAKPEASSIRPGKGSKKPELIKISKKTAIRFFLSVCRNAVYAKLVQGGMGAVNASMLAQGIYGFFAQNRDLVYDLMKGEGWVKQTETTTDLVIVNENEASASDNIIPDLEETTVVVSTASTSVSSSTSSSEVSAPSTTETSSEVSTEKVLT